MLSLTQLTGFNRRRRTRRLLGRGTLDLTTGLSAEGIVRRVGEGTLDLALGLTAAGVVRTPLLGTGTLDLTTGMTAAGNSRSPVAGAGTLDLTTGMSADGSVITLVPRLAAAYWKFEEGGVPPDPRVDATGNLFDLTPYLGLGYITQETGLIGYATGITDTRFLYTGDGDGNDPLIQTNDRMSIAGWFKLSDFGSPGDITGILYKGSSFVPSEWEWGVHVDEDNLVFSVGVDGPGSVSVSVPITGLEDTWIFFAAVADFIGNTIQISVNDGTPVSDTLSGTYTVQNNQYRVGPTPATLLTVDELGKYNIALTAGQITELYNGGAGITY